MVLIVGLGNPGAQYAGTRHNVGFEVINKLAYDYNIDINKAKHCAHIGEGMIHNKKVALVRPQTYMNLSGESVRDIVNFYKIPTEDLVRELIVIHDDISLEPGMVRIREKGSPGGHNGMKNIIYQLETDEFLRIKVGIGEKPKNWDLADYVLSKFAKDEQDDIIDGITYAAEAAGMLLKEGVSAAMNQYNKKNRSAEN